MWCSSVFARNASPPVLHGGVLRDVEASSPDATRGADPGALGPRAAGGAAQGAGRRHRRHHRRAARRRPLAPDSHCSRLTKRATQCFWAAQRGCRRPPIWFTIVTYDCAGGAHRAARGARSGAAGQPARDVAGLGHQHAARGPSSRGGREDGAGVELSAAPRAAKMFTLLIICEAQGGVREVVLRGLGN